MQVTQSNTVFDFRCGPIPQVVQIFIDFILPRYISKEKLAIL